MIIDITKSCSMGCSHCLSDCVKSDQHMSMDVFGEALNFAKRHFSGVIFIAGGEPTEHPQFIDFLEYALRQPMISHVAVLTNGVWLQNNKNYVKQLCSSYPNLFWQVTNDERYYPIKLNYSDPIFLNKQITLVRQIGNIFPQGRAKRNNLAWSAKASKCFNIRSIVRQVYAMYGYPTDKGKLLKASTRLLASNGYFCTPCIGPSGEIRLGESLLCPICSTIFDNPDVIVSNILNFRCSLCKEVNSKLPKLYRNLINEE